MRFVFSHIYFISLTYYKLCSCSLLPLSSFVTSTYYALSQASALEFKFEFNSFSFFFLFFFSLFSFPFFFFLFSHIFSFIIPFMNLIAEHNTLHSTKDISTYQGMLVTDIPDICKNHVCKYGIFQG